MSNNMITPSDFFNPDTQVAHLGLIACPGAEELTNLIDVHLRRWAKEVGIEKDTFIIESACPRFQSGDAKGLVKESVRGDDIFIVVDPACGRDKHPSYSIPSVSHIENFVLSVLFFYFYYSFFYNLKSCF